MIPIDYISRGAAVLTADEAAELRADVAECGDVEISRRIGISRVALARAAARFAVHNGTAALTRAYLALRQAA